MQPDGFPDAFQKRGLLGLFLSLSGKTLTGVFHGEADEFPFLAPPGRLDIDPLSPLFREPLAVGVGVPYPDGQKNPPRNVMVGKVEPAQKLPKGLGLLAVEAFRRKIQLVDDRPSPREQDGELVALRFPVETHHIGVLETRGLNPVYLLVLPKALQLVAVVGRVFVPGLPRRALHHLPYGSGELFSLSLEKRRGLLHQRPVVLLRYLPRAGTRAELREVAETRAGPVPFELVRGAVPKWEEPVDEPYGLL